MQHSGIFQFANSINVAVVKWMYSKYVIVVSSATGKDPASEIDRWNKNLKRRCPI